MVKFFSVILLLTLAACGFTPLYGSREQANEYLAHVRIENIPNRSGQQLRLLLEDRFHGAQVAAAPKYSLNVTFYTAKEELGIKRDDVATRARLGLTGSFTLSEIGSAEAPYTSSVRSIVSYNILTDPYATFSAEQDATERGLVQLADAITARVALHLAGNEGAVKAVAGSEDQGTATGADFMNDSETILRNSTPVLERTQTAN